MGADHCGEQVDRLPASAYTRFRDLRITKQLGEGMYGTVRMAVNEHAFSDELRFAWHGRADALAKVDERRVSFARALRGAHVENA